MLVFFCGRPSSDRLVPAPRQGAQADMGEGPGAYELRLREAFGRNRLDQIRRQEIQSFHAGLRGEGLSPAYADHFIKLLRHALNLAIE